MSALLICPRTLVCPFLFAAHAPYACLSVQVMGEVAVAQQQREKRRCEALLASSGRDGGGGFGADGAEAGLQLEYAAYVVAGGCVRSGEEAGQKLDGGEGGTKRKLRE